MSKTLTTAEQVAAMATLKKLESIAEKYPGTEASVTEMRSEIATLKSNIEELSKIDVKAVSDSLETIKATQASITKSLRRHRGVGFVPGLEDESEAKKFSISRCMIAVRTGRWDRAPYEREVTKAAYDVALKDGHQISIDSAGGAFVPDQVLADIIPAIYTASVLVGLGESGPTRISVLDGLTGGKVSIPKFDGGMIAYWIGEMDPFTETVTKSGNVSMTPKKLGVLTRITAEMAQLNGYGFENLLRNDMVRAIAKEIDRCAIYGKGTENEPRGVVRYPEIFRFYGETDSTTAPTFASANGDYISFDNLQDAIGVLEDNELQPDSSWAWIGSPAFFRRLAQQKVTYFSGQTSNQGYLLGMPMVTPEKLRALIGEFGKTTQIKNNNKPNANNYGTNAVPNGSSSSNCTDVLGANWNNVLMGRWGGMVLEDDGGKGSGFTTDQTYIKAKMLVDFGPRQAKNIVHIPDARMS